MNSKKVTQQNQSRTITSIFRDCLSKSSVRGLPRVLTAQHIVLKVIWFSIIVGLVALMLYNIVEIIVAYNRKDTIFTTSPWRPRPRSPSITVCDLSPMPIGYSHMKYPPSEYRDRLIKMSNNSKMLKHLLKQDAYYEQLDVTTIRQYANNTVLLPATCTILYRDEQGVLQEKACDKITRSFSKQFFSCNTISLTNVPQLIEVRFHLLAESEPASLTCNTCIYEDQDSVRDGSVLFVHEPDILPLNAEDGYHVMPGTNNIFLVKQKLNKNLKGCSSVYPSTHTFMYINEKQNTKYTNDVCKLLEKQKYSYQTCNCTISFLPRPMDVPPDQKSCLWQNLSLAYLQQENVNCDMFNLTKLSKSKCPKPCEIIRYSVSQSSAKGIPKAYELHTYQELIKMQYHMLNSSVFQGYKEALELQSTNPEKALQILKQNDYLQNNFVSITLKFSDQYNIILTEQIVISFNALLSQLGGTLALFGGITLVCIGELAELGYLLVCHFKHRESTNSMPHNKQCQEFVPSTQLSRFSTSQNKIDIETKI